LIGRDVLLARAVALAGAAYVAPALTSSTMAEAEACAGQPCATGKKGARKCRKRGGRQCRCTNGTCGRRDEHCPHDRCTHGGTCLQPLHACQSGNCGCFLNGHGQDPGVWIDVLDGLCSTFLERFGSCPNGDDGECPPGTACFCSGCQDFGYPLLCGPCCPATGSPAPAVSSTEDGPRIHG
jgi:hypothetical protein